MLGWRLRLLGPEAGTLTVAEVASSADIAGAASLAIAEVASLADIAGAVSPAVAGAVSLAVAGVASLAIAGAAPSADIAGAASQDVAGVASSADIVGAASPAVAGVASSADGVGVVSSTDLVGDGCISGMNAVKCENDWLADSTYPDVDFPHSDSQSRIWQERDPDIIRAPGSVAVLPINKDLPGTHCWTLRTSICDPVKISAVQAWHAPGTVKQCAPVCWLSGILPSVHPKTLRRYRYLMWP